VLGEDVTAGTSIMKVVCLSSTEQQDKCATSAEHQQPQHPSGIMPVAHTLVLDSLWLFPGA
jgi:hypothetical protein